MQDECVFQVPHVTHLCKDDFWGFVSPKQKKRPLLLNKEAAPFCRKERKKKLATDTCDVMLLRDVVVTLFKGYGQWTDHMRQYAVFGRPPTFTLDCIIGEAATLITIWS